MDLKVNSIIQLKKSHPCGSYEWEVIRVGADIKIKCCTCNHLVMLPRRKLEKNIKKILS